jgi:hypothetical protein
MSVTLQVCVADLAAVDLKLKAGKFPNVKVCDLPSEDSMAQMDFVEAYNLINPRLNVAWKPDFEKVFFTLFWNWASPSGNKIYELSADADTVGIDSAIGTHNCAALLQCWKNVKIDEARSAFAGVKLDQNGYIQNYEEFAAYAQAWIKALQNAHDAKLGLVVRTFG